MLGFLPGLCLPLCASICEIVKNHQKICFLRPLILTNYSLDSGVQVRRQSDWSAGGQHGKKIKKFFLEQAREWMWNPGRGGLRPGIGAGVLGMVVGICPGLGSSSKSCMEQQAHKDTYVWSTRGRDF